MLDVGEANWKEPGRKRSPLSQHCPGRRSPLCSPVRCLHSTAVSQENSGLDSHSPKNWFNRAFRLRVTCLAYQQTVSFLPAFQISTKVEQSVLNLTQSTRVYASLVLVDRLNHYCRCSLLIFRLFAAAPSLKGPKYIFNLPYNAFANKKGCISSCMYK
jgi:hypothetical protein